MELDFQFSKYIFRALCYVVTEFGKLDWCGQSGYEHIQVISSCLLTLKKTCEVSPLEIAFGE